VLARAQPPQAAPQPPKVAPPPQVAPPAAPATSVPGPCSADLVARYLAEVARQPPARRPAPGSVVALTEGGKACLMQMPAAAAAPAQQSGSAQPPAPPQRVMVRGPDGKYRIMTLAEAAAAGGGPPQFRTPSLAGEFSNLGSTPLLIGPPMQSYAGELVFGPLPNGPPGYLTKLGLAYDWAEAKIAAQVNWARENKAEAAIAALSLAVSLALPQVPAVAALGSVGSALVSGLVAPVMATSTTHFINTLASTGRTDKAFLAATKESAVVVVTSLPSAFAGETFKAFSEDIGAAGVIMSMAEYGVSKGADMAVQYAPAVLSRPVPAERTVSFTPPLDR
jgi:hypothetical protein